MLCRKQRATPGQTAAAGATACLRSASMPTAWPSTCAVIPEPASVSLDGLTGHLTLDRDGHVRRELSWAQVKNGEVRLLPAAGAPAQARRRQPPSTAASGSATPRRHRPARRAGRRSPSRPRMARRASLARARDRRQPAPLGPTLPPSWAARRRPSRRASWRATASRSSCATSAGDSAKSTSSPATATSW